MSVREANKQKRWRRCLKCGRKMLTDRCHRICKRCNEENNYVRGAVTIRQGHLAATRDSGEQHKSQDGFDWYRAANAADE